MSLDAFLPNVDGRPIVVDAKYKSEVSSSNLQQMVTYCWMTGARTAVLVFPIGQLSARQTYVFDGTTGNQQPIEIHLVELDITATDLAGWKRAGARLVDAIHASQPPRDREARRSG